MRFQRAALRSGMPRDGAMTLSDLPVDRLVVVCDRCPRRGVYSVARLMATRGDAKIPDLLADLSADCPKRLAMKWSDLCGVGLER